MQSYFQKDYRLSPVRCGVSLTGLALALAVSSTVHAQETDPEAVAQESSPGLIIVTARKRSETTLEVPETVTAFSEETLERANIEDIDDVGLAVPNLQLSTRADGFPNVTVRGLGGFGNTQGVGFYLDDVQLFSDASSRFGDLERIEVLKGPQGILYGGSNIGGAVKFVSARPELGIFEGRIAAKAGTDNYFDGEIELNVPLGSNWAFKAFAFGETDDSFLTNAQTPRQSGGIAAGSEDIGKREQYGVRGALYGDLGGPEIYLTARYNELDGPNNLWIRELDGDFQYSRTLDLSYNPRNTRETFGLTGHVDIPVGDLTLQSITSYTETESRRETDLDILNEFVLDLFRPEDFEAFTQEIRLSSDDSGPFVWQVGGYLLDLSRDLDSVLIIREGFCFIDPGACAPLSTNDDEILAEVPFEVSRRSREQIAAFVNASYEFGQIEVSGGLRVDNTTSERDNLDTGLSGKTKETVVLGRASVAWSNFDETTLLYATFSQGFEPGDFSLSNLSTANSLLQYNKETADQIEIGYKGRLLDNNLFLTIAAFYVDYQDRQFELQTVDPVTDTPVEGIVNVGDSTQKGIEVDFVWQLSNNLTFSGGAGYIDAEWDEGVVSPVTGLSLGGVQPPNVAKWSGSGALEYEGDIGNGEFFVRGQARYKSKSSTNAQFFDVPGDDYPIFVNPSYFVFDLAAGVDFGNLSFGARAENIFDKKYFTDVQEFPNFAGSLNPGEPGQIIIGTFGQAQRFILSVGYEF
ncbi:Outer membrane receptor proteins, mostly Fe transport [Altererythrobacter xiamenensis]|uniref:Outer membrane receptor proteins, mostly Fe transport n=1 Tax=Altererythrobacter xiamenensis TaxID=1316679 RepID=A0A1Y6FAQ4_9SPHN|nr:TonB-dependent receptor [Altererythrobacter xiamenensis]SMQ69493.1 Outer membrane receptor proteins, mostly Fe transport [Altererythrobacter xiamenensis]